MKRQFSTGFFYLLCIFFLALWLLLYRLSDLMLFFGDIGWFYLSARDMLLTGRIPLVGITSSHTWLHQGPIWTYLLGIALWVGRFNPLSGGYLAVLFGLGSLGLLYLVARTWFSERTSLIAALLFATSPLVIIHARMPYHTAPIPFFTLLLFYAVSKWVKGEGQFFPLVLFSLVMLYNFELATVIFFIPCLFIFIYGFVKRAKWMRQLKSSKLIGFSLLAFIVPMVPILIYDVQHNFPQTLRYAVWMGYKVLTVFGYPELHPDTPSVSYATVGTFFYQHLQTLLFLPNGVVALLLLVGSLAWLLFEVYQESWGGKESKGVRKYLLLGLFYVVSVGGFFAAKTTSEAYLPMLFPFIILVLAGCLTALISLPWARYFAVILLSVIVIGNVITLLGSNYLMGIPHGYGPTFTTRLTAAKEIMKEAGKQAYNLKGSGSGSQFQSFTMNYSYLSWWKGHAPSAEKAETVFVISEDEARVSIEKEEQK